MSKKHEMSDQEYRVYQQNHAYEDVIGTEEEKIQREKRGAVNHRRNSARHLQKLLRSMTPPKVVNETAVGVRDLKGAVPSTRGPEWTDL